MVEDLKREVQMEKIIIKPKFVNDCDTCFFSPYADDGSVMFGFSAAVLLVCLVASLFVYLWPLRKS